MKHLFLIVVVCLACLVWPVEAQDAPRLSLLEISLWPEYDQPGVLVIHRGQFAPTATVPLPVEIWIPARVGQPSAVAYTDGGGQPFTQAYTTRVEGDQRVVAFELPTRGFQLEYYDLLPVDASGRREYVFSYVADYDVAALNLEVQVPPTAQEFTLDPPAEAVFTEADGLVYHRASLEGVARGQETTWKLSYEKDNEDLTLAAAAQPVTAASTAAASAASNDDSTVLIFFVAFVALVAAGGGAFWLGRRTQPAAEAAAAPSRRPRRRGSGSSRRPQAPGPSASASRDAFFCHRCGAQLRADSQFCHQCGAAVRGE